MRARLPSQVHTTYEERLTLLKFGKVIGRAIEELISIVSPATFYRWVREEKNGRPKKQGIQPGPDRNTDSWDNFIKRHTRRCGRWTSSR